MRKTEEILNKVRGNPANKKRKSNKNVIDERFTPFMNGTAGRLSDSQADAQLLRDQEAARKRRGEADAAFEERLATARALVEKAWPSAEREPGSIVETDADRDEAALGWADGHAPGCKWLYSVAPCPCKGKSEPTRMGDAPGSGETYGTFAPPEE
jgi:hypothetical protein